MLGHPVQILAIEDDIQDIKLIQKDLRRAKSFITHLEASLMVGDSGFDWVGWLLITEAFGTFWLWSKSMLFFGLNSSVINNWAGEKFVGTGKVKPTSVSNFSPEKSPSNSLPDCWCSISLLSYSYLAPRNLNMDVNSIKLINRPDKSLTKMKMKFMKVGEPSQAQKRESLPQVLRFSAEWEWEKSSSHCCASFFKLCWKFSFI